MARDALEGDGGPALVVAHDIRGRLRLRLPPGARTDGLAEAVGQLPGVALCTFTPATRSLLVRYDPEALEAAELVHAAALHAEVEVPHPPRPRRTAPRAPSPISAALVASVGRIDQRLHEVTHGTLDLGTLMPLALAFWAVREVFRGQVAPLAWSSALWYAHGLFRDYNLAAPEPAATSESVATPER
jgi:hypothetical protein